MDFFLSGLPLLVLVILACQHAGEQELQERLKWALIEIWLDRLRDRIYTEQQMTNATTPSTSEQSELAACPFCGGNKIANCHDDGLFWKRCTSCGATGPEATKYSGEEGDPFIDWNSRAAVAPPVDAEGEEAYCANCRSHHLLPLCAEPEYFATPSLPSVAPTGEDGLALCPFCRANAFISWDGDVANPNDWSAVCYNTLNCGASIGGMDSQDAARKAWNTRTATPVVVGEGEQALSGFVAPGRLSTQEDTTVNNYDAFRVGMLRAAQMARDEFKRAPEAAKGHDCVYMSGYEDACDHLSVIIAQAAVIDSVRIAGAQPDWQYHISLLLPDEIEDQTVLKIYQVVEHEIRQAATTQSSEVARAAAEEIAAQAKTATLNLNKENWLLSDATTEELDKVAAIIAKAFRPPLMSCSRPRQADQLHGVAKAAEEIAKRFLQGGRGAPHEIEGMAAIITKHLGSAAVPHANLVETFLQEVYNDTAHERRRSILMEFASWVDSRSTTPPVTEDSPTQAKI